MYVVIADIYMQIGSHKHLSNIKGRMYVNYSSLLHRETAQNAGNAFETVSRKTAGNYFKKALVIIALRDQRKGCATKIQSES